MDEFYTLTAYIHDDKKITYAMEDYLEMIYRMNFNNQTVTITNLSNNLNIKKPSCSKMISKLKFLNLVIIDNKEIKLKDYGITLGRYLYHRHLILAEFLQKINQEKFSLEQVEKIEHFIDFITLKNIHKLNKML